MTDYVTAYQTPGTAYHREAVSLAARLSADSIIAAGIMRWKSNGSVPPADCIALAAFIGLPVDPERCTWARDQEISEFLAEYRKNQSQHPSAEQQAEMRAAFGPGKRVVNIITGRVTRT